MPLVAALLGHLEQLARDERELLQRGDDHRHGVLQRFGELPRALVDPLHHAALVLELVDRVLKLLDLLLLLLPVHAEGRIGEEVVEGLARELVLGEAVAEADVVAAAVVVHLLHQHVGRGGGEGALVVVLPVDVEPASAWCSRR